MSLPAPPTATGARRDEGDIIPRGAPALRVGQAAAPSVVRWPQLSVAWATTRPVEAGSPGVSAALDWIVWPSAPAVSSVAFVGRLHQRMQAAFKLLFGPATTAGG